MARNAAPCVVGRGSSLNYVPRSGLDLAPTANSVSMSDSVWAKAVLPSAYAQAVENYCDGFLALVLFTEADDRLKCQAQQQDHRPDASARSAPAARARPMRRSIAASIAVQGFRVSVPGFTELTAVSHFGPAIGTIAALKERGLDVWRGDALALVEDARRVRAVNSAELWAAGIAVDAFIGRQKAIARMTDYACAISERYLSRALEDSGYLSGRTLREDLLDGRGQAELPVSLNRIMIATFGLVALEFGHRFITWVQKLDPDWSRTLFAVAGRQGRPTGGTTKSTTNLARIIHIVSRAQLDEKRVFIAPHLPVFAHPIDGDLQEVIAIEEPIRWQLARVMSSAELAPLMFDGYPEFVQPPLYGPQLADGAQTVTEMPRIQAPDDWTTMYARLRMSLEDPRQLLASGVTDYIVQQLVDNGNDPERIIVPGLDNEPYPELQGRDR